MKERDSWDGSAPTLRHELRQALEQDQPVPEGKFGFHVERTVSKSELVIVNLAGQPHQLSDRGQSKLK